MNVVIAESPPILELLACEDQSLLLRRNPLFVLDFRLDILNRVIRLDVEGYRLSRESFDESVFVCHFVCQTESNENCVICLFERLALAPIHGFLWTFRTRPCMAMHGHAWPCMLVRL